jgi:hypothetical protein
MLLCHHSDALCLLRSIHFIAMFARFDPSPLLISYLALPSCDFISCHHLRAMLSPSCDFVSCRRLCTISFHVIAFVRFHFLAPCILGVYLFPRRSFSIAPCILGVPHFLSEVFFSSPLRFRGAAFFIGGLFS